MDGYTKLHSVILDSSIWGEPLHVRVVFLTALAMADGSGQFECSIGGFARRAQVTLEQCREALEVLQGPDADSRDGTTGERLQFEGAGLWTVINHGAYRERSTRRQTADAKRKREAREAATLEEEATQTQTHTQSPGTHADVHGHPRMSTDIPDVPVVSEAKPKKKPEQAACPDDIDPDLWAAWLSARKAKKAPAPSTVAWKLFVTEVGKVNWPIDKALEECVARNWISFKADWLKSPFAKPDGKSHAIPKTPHDSALDVGDDRCECMSCKAMRRDRRAS
jgi:hypothetical protein